MFRSFSPVHSRGVADASPSARERCMAAPQGRQSAAGDCCEPGSLSSGPLSAQMLQVPAPCTPAAARLRPLLSTAAACSASEPSAPGEREEGTVAALLLLHSSAMAPTTTGHKRDASADGPGGSVMPARKQGRPPRPKPSDMPVMRVDDPISPGSRAAFGYDPLDDQEEEPSLVVTHGGGERQAKRQGRPPRPKPSDMPAMRVDNPISPGSRAAFGYEPLEDQEEEPSLVATHGGGERQAKRHAEQTALATTKQRRVRPFSPQPGGSTIIRDVNTGFWPSDVFFPGQPGGRHVKDPLDHRSVAAVKLYNCTSTRCRDGGCCTKLSDLDVLEVRQEYNNGSAASSSSDPEKLKAVVQAARNDRVKGEYDTVKISLKRGDPVHVCLPAFALIAGYTGSALKKALHDMSAAPSGSLVPCTPQLHPREKEAQDIMLARSYIRGVLTSAHEQQPVTSLGCSSGKQTCLTKRTWKVHAPCRTALEHTFRPGRTARTAPH